MRRLYSREAGFDLLERFRLLALDSRQFRLEGGFLGLEGALFSLERVDPLLFLERLLPR